MMESHPNLAGMTGKYGPAFAARLLTLPEYQKECPYPWQ